MLSCNARIARVHGPPLITEISVADNRLGISSQWSNLMTPPDSRAPNTTDSWQGPQPHQLRYRREAPMLPRSFRVLTSHQIWYRHCRWFKQNGLRSAAVLLPLHGIRWQYDR